MQRFTIPTSSKYIYQNASTITAVMTLSGRVKIMNLVQAVSTDALTSMDLSSHMLPPFKPVSSHIRHQIIQEYDAARVPWPGWQL
jgi:hypothetical protein